MEHSKAQIYYQNDADIKVLTGRTIAVIGYGNQGRAQALNLRDNNIKTIVGNRDDSYRKVAEADSFDTYDIQSAVSMADIILLLLPDEILPNIYKNQILPYLREGCALVFASGYNVAFELINFPENIDVLLLAPRMIGIGVRERFLTKEGFYCFIGLHQDYSSLAKDILLALTMGIGGLIKPAIEMSFKQEAILDLFNEQAFGPAFGRVLLTAIFELLEHGLPPEAVLVEMYMSEEMAYTYRKMAYTGLVKQTLFHSQTSQYGAMSRGIRFLDLDIKNRMEKIFQEIENGSFAREWNNPLTRLKFKAIRFFAMNQKINQIENTVRRRLGLDIANVYTPAADIQTILKNKSIITELEAFEDSFEF